MGLAISLVASEKEKVGQHGGLILYIIFLFYYYCSFFGDLKSVIQKKTTNDFCANKQVWYHVCPNRGRGCYNTRLREDGGCTIWYNEKEVRLESSTNPVPH